MILAQFNKLLRLKLTSTGETLLDLKCVQTYKNKAKQKFYTR